MDTTCPVAWCTAVTHSEGHSGDHRSMVAYDGAQIDLWPVWRPGEPEPVWVLALELLERPVDYCELDADRLTQLADLLTKLAPPRPDDDGPLTDPRD